LFKQFISGRLTALVTATFGAVEGGRGQFSRLISYFHSLNDDLDSYVDPADGLCISHYTMVNACRMLARNFDNHVFVIGAQKVLGEASDENTTKAVYQKIKTEFSAAQHLRVVSQRAAVPPGPKSPVPGDGADAPEVAVPRTRAGQRVPSLPGSPFGLIVTVGGGPSDAGGPDPSQGGLSNSSVVANCRLVFNALVSILKKQLELNNAVDTTGTAATTRATYERVRPCTVARPNRNNCDVALPAATSSTRHIIPTEIPVASLLPALCKINLSALSQCYSGVRKIINDEKAISDVMYHFESTGLFSIIPTTATTSRSRSLSLVDKLPKDALSNTLDVREMSERVTPFATLNSFLCYYYQCARDDHLPPGVRRALNIEA